MYAKDTSVSVEKSQSELKSMLTRYGAGKTMLAEDHDSGEAVVQFVANDRLIRFRLSLPQRSDKKFWFTAHSTPKRRSDVLLEIAYQLGYSVAMCHQKHYPGMRP